MRKLQLIFACGYSAEDKAAVAKYRQWLLVVWLVGVMPFTWKHFPGRLGLAASVVEGSSFAAVLILAWMIALRSGDEYRRLLLQRSLALGTAMMTVALSVCGFVEFQMHRSLELPLGLIPVGLALLTVAAKLIVFRRANA
ncbi:hypothetical protein [Granulicella paludicola]|uniref:hypothetical protein n=1 Tax=Granulicella paludicola TaxID=474951 RepID=UPI0021E08911|nr:hypothetical protein [Granulicella paludicola]